MSNHYGRTYVPIISTSKLESIEQRMGPIDIDWTPLKRWNEHCALAAGYYAASGVDIFSNLERYESASNAADLRRARAHAPPRNPLGDV